MDVTSFTIFVYCSWFCYVYTKTVKVTYEKFPLKMPNVHPDFDDSYICTPVKIVPNKTFYIVGFEPKASNKVHHMIVVGCEAPGSYELFWDCGEMAERSSSHLIKASPCANGSNVLYAWALKADSLELPNNVGFEVGEQSAYKYIILQVHYMERFAQGDSSGINLIFTETPQPYLAGVLLMGTMGYIPPHSVTYMETLCELKQNTTIYPIAYRTHTHQLGMVVSAYRIHRDEFGQDHWTLLGKRDPLTPQMFYRIFNADPIRPGERLAARCTMNSYSRKTYTKIGQTNQDEMCNFYLLYYVKNHNDLLDMKYCVTAGPPQFHWSDPYNDLNNIPDKDASSLD